MSDTPRTDALFESLHLPYNNDIPVEITIHAMNLERELAATKRELELFQKDAAQKTYKESQSITADRKIAELEHDLFALKSKADRCETEMNKQSARANAAEARVRELEGLEITGTHYFSDFVGVAVTLPLGSTPTIGRTLGEAMPVGASVVHGKTCPKAPHIGDGYLHAGDDDKPYDVDGVSYCGRCHTAMPGGSR